jgi:hypothetical protein
MNLVNLLGRKLKDDVVVQFFEEFQVGDVFCGFDRFDESTDEKYWANAKASDFEVVFDQDQVLVKAFCYMSPIDGFVSVTSAVAGVPLFISAAEAECAAMIAGHRCTKGSADLPLLGLRKAWVRHERPDAWVHYEFRDGALALVTLSRPKS